VGVVWQMMLATASGFTREGVLVGKGHMGGAQSMVRIEY